MGLKVDFTYDWNLFSESKFPKINYSEKVCSNSISFSPHKILFDFGIKDYTIEVINHSQFNKIFFKNQNGTILFDLFGAVFWLLSRYEEYLPHKTDSFNRFHYKTSIAYQYDFIKTPLVNVWLNELKNILESNFPELQFVERTYNYISTVDIDNAFKYKHKGFVRTLAGYLSDILHKDFAGVKSRTQILFTKKEDPFDNYRFLIDANIENNIKAIYFILLGDYGVNDKNHSASNLDFQALIKHLSDYSAVGIHPSFGSTNNLHQFKVEVARLSKIIHKDIFKSRQHFSMLKFPQTYQSLLQSGISEDYSMGYTNINGFRASYCYPFKWYNLDEEMTTPLIIHPFAISENTLEFFANKEKLGFIELAKPIINEVKKYNGQLISIFHNDTFVAHMKENYIEFLKEAK